MSLKNGQASIGEKSRDVHWRTDDDGYEYIMREIFMASKTLVQAEREKWLTKGWRDRLEKWRKAHRTAGIPDSQFWHPQKKKEAARVG